jgi:hypothetical protein
VECRKIYWQDIDPEHFIGSGIMEHYAKGDYHRAYFGEILGLRGTDFYRA